MITHKKFLQYHKSKMVALIERGWQHNNGSHACCINYGNEIINKLDVSFVSVGVELEVLK